MEQHHVQYRLGQDTCYVMIELLFDCDNLIKIIESKADYRYYRYKPIRFISRLIQFFHLPEKNVQAFPVSSVVTLCIPGLHLPSTHFLHSIRPSLEKFSRILCCRTSAPFGQIGSLPVGHRTITAIILLSFSHKPLLRELRQRPSITIDPLQTSIYRRFRHAASICIANYVLTYAKK